MVKTSGLGWCPSVRAVWAALWLVWGCLAIAPQAGAGTRDAGFVAALHSITRAELYDHEEILASDAFEGREAGMPGGESARQYLLAALQRYALKPAGSEGFLQPFSDRFCNVIAELPGSDPALQNEYLVLAAHYDHVGYGTPRNVRDGPGSVHNGADDNASGTAALLEIAQACTLLPRPPRRSLLFIFFDAEEKGLLGSRFWVEHPTRPLDKVKLMINMDMVGRLRLDRIELYGWRTAAGLRPVVTRANSSAGFDIEFSWMNRFDSDHAPFFLKSIPVLLFHTGLHEDYHKATDDVERINFEGMERVSRWVFDITYELANAETLPAFRKAVTEDSELRRMDLLKAPPNWRDRLGITVEQISLPGSDSAVVLRVAKILHESPAAAAGIGLGDWILAVDGRPVKTVEEFTAAVLLKDGPSVRLTLRPQFGEAPEGQREVHLQGPPVRLGVQWTPDEAVPQAVMVTHVLPGSPAEAAGLQPGDYIYSVNGAAVDPDRFEQMVLEAPLPLRLEVDHRGRLRTLEIPAHPERREAEWSPGVPSPTRASAKGFPWRSPRDGFSVRPDAWRQVLSTPGGTFINDRLRTGTPEGSGVCCGV